MKTPPDGWDKDEREILELPNVASDLEAMRARHALGPEDEARLLARIQQEAARAATTPGAGFRRWGWLAAAAAVVLVAGTIWLSRRSADAPVEGPTERTQPPESTVAGAKPAPSFYLALEKPDLKVSAAALTWRSPRGENTLLADLKPAFDAFRAGDYQLADREFSRLSVTYPNSIEVALYQGVARLFTGDVPGAVTSLTLAEKLADSSFASEVAWYRAVAEERSGNLAAARARLNGLCAQTDVRAKAACDALKRLPGGLAPAP
jgi:hypothetical protein